MFRKISFYSDLIKYKLSLAVVLSAVTGYFLFSNTIGHHLIFLAAGIFLLSSGSAALNQYTERIADSMMERTRNRPIPSKKISERSALCIASLLLFSGCIFLYINGI
jgi:protoheme IX farnesyltransferase